MLMKRIIVNQDGREAPEVILGDVPAVVYEMDVQAEGILGVAHRHHEVQISVVSRGKIRFEVAGQSYDLEKGEALFINAEMMHAAYPMDEGPCIYTCLKFTPQAVSSGDYSLTRRYVSPIVSERAAAVVLLDEKASGTAEEAAGRIAGLLAENRLCTELEVVRELIRLWIEVYRCAEKRNEDLIGVTRSEKMRIHTMCDYIHNNYAEKISLNDIANAAFVSKGECCRIFKRVLQLSPFQYLVRYRLKLSVQLLNETDLSIAEIAQQVGFCSSSYYTKCFRREYNCAPHVYRTEQGRRNLRRDVS